MAFFGELNQAWIRAMLILIFLVPFGFLTKKFKMIKAKDLIWFILIAAAGGLNHAPYFYGFEHLPVGTATLLFYMMLTIGAYILGKLFFEEKMTKVKYFSLILAVIGLNIIYRFSLTGSQIIPAIATMFSGFLGACAVVFSKKLSSYYTETQILTVLFSDMVIINLAICFIFKENVPVISFSTAWLAEAAYASTMLIANTAVIEGFKYLEPSIGSLIGLLEVIFCCYLWSDFFQRYHDYSINHWQSNNYQFCRNAEYSKIS
ncbi:DMT family transporter [Candidatus Beckwithbacteria bacterium]|nr:DMT family transporter [Candidatus Beckwithbacteria bacterium]